MEGFYDTGVPCDHHRNDTILAPFLIKKWFFVTKQAEKKKKSMEEAAGEMEPYMTEKIKGKCTLKTLSPPTSGISCLLTTHDSLQVRI